MVAAEDLGGRRRPFPGTERCSRTRWRSTRRAILGRVLTADRRVFAQVGEARNVSGEYTLVLRGGTEVRLGAAEDLPLQLAIAGRVLGVVDGEARYVDVSVPERAVVG